QVEHMKGLALQQRRQTDVADVADAREAFGQQSPLLDRLGKNLQVRERRVAEHELVEGPVLEQRLREVEVGDQPAKLARLPARLEERKHRAEALYQRLTCKTTICAAPIE